MAVVIIILFFLSKADFFQTATEAFANRFESANENEGGLSGVFLDRFLGGMVGALQNSADLPFWGFGIGKGTNVGAMLLTGNQVFLISEGEWGRLIGELGALLGTIVIFLRLSFCVKITYAGYQKLRQGDLLPWMLISFGFLIILQGQWAQPTTLGFSTLMGGLIIASFNNTKTLREPFSSIRRKENTLFQKNNKN